MVFPEVEPRCQVRELTCWRAMPLAANVGCNARAGTGSADQGVRMSGWLGLGDGMKRAYYWRYGELDVYRPRGSAAGSRRCALRQPFEQIGSRPRQPNRPRRHAAARVGAVLRADGMHRWGG